jgi:hypothetical protein
MFRVLITIMLLMICTGCGSKEESAGGEQTQTASKAGSQTGSHEGESRSMIPDKVEPATTTEGVFIRPYFDEQGTVTETSVAPGETFTLYVHAEYEEPYHMSAVEYRIGLPAGVRIESSTPFLGKAVVVGDYTKDFILAFGCEPPRKYYLVKYECAVDERFAGGAITLAPGVNEVGVEFLGFVSCRPGTEKIPVAEATAILKTK